MNEHVHALIEKGDMILLVELDIDVFVPHGRLGQGETAEEALVRIVRDTVGVRAIPYQAVASESSDDAHHVFWRCMYMSGLPEASKGVAGWYSRQEAAMHVTARYPALSTYFGGQG